MEIIFPMWMGICTVWSTILRVILTLHRLAAEITRIKEQVQESSELNKTLSRELSMYDTITLKNSGKYYWLSFTEHMQY